VNRTPWLGATQGAKRYGRANSGMRNRLR
jgi:hypothetical protein